MTQNSKIVIVIGAVSQDGVYGVENQIPWRIKAEMEHFKKQTTGHTVVMGRGTWESLPEKFRPLPNRANFVITNTPGYEASGATIFASLEQAIDAAETEKVFCIGGKDIWYHAMSLADEALITEVKADFWKNQPGVRMAEELLNPRSKWPRFQLASSIDGGEGDGAFTVHHWFKA